MNNVNSERFIKLDKVANVRDLGGLVMEDGRRIRKGLLLRGGDLHNATDADIAALSKYNIRQIFDFRTDIEVGNAPDREIEGADNLWLPTIDPETEKFGYSLPEEAYRNIGFYIIKHTGDRIVRDVARRLYSDMVMNEYTQLQYASFLQIISKLDDGAVFWHCSQGKDRTGLGAAFLLAALGASRETIMEDFALSNEYYRTLIDDMSERVLSIGGGQADLAVVQAFIGVNTANFNAALDLITKHYGSLHQYTREALQLSPGDSMALRRRLLED